MLNVICLKHGTKYSPDYVNKLYNMIERHLTVPHRFVCFTDDTSHLNPKIECRILPSNQRIQGWWWKPYIFKVDHFPLGDTNLFFDLDMVIVGNIDNLANYLPSEFVGLEDVSRVFKTVPQKLGSAVLKWPSGKFSDICDDLYNDPTITTRFPGDQDYIWKKYQGTIKFFPRDWIVSYKWEVRNRMELVRVNGRQVFKDVRDVELHKDTAVLAFHGSPDPHEVKDPVIINNWR
jgi:hypothetical protein